jgi:hypothetical protein
VKENLLRRKFNGSESGQQALIDREILKRFGSGMVSGDGLVVRSFEPFQQLRIQRRKRTAENK